MIEIFKELFSDGWSAFKIGMSGLTVANIISILTCIFMSLKSQKKAKANTDKLLEIIDNLKASEESKDNSTSTSIVALRGDLGLTQENILIMAKYLCNGEDLTAIVNNYKKFTTPTELTEQVLAEKQAEEKQAEEQKVTKEETLKEIEAITAEPFENKNQETLL